MTRTPGVRRTPAERTDTGRALPAALTAEQGDRHRVRRPGRQVLDHVREIEDSSVERSVDGGEGARRRP